MQVDVVYGETRNRAAAAQLVDALTGVVQDGTIYLGYPVLAAADERVHLDVLLASNDRGLVAFQLAEDVPDSLEGWRPHIEDQDRLYSVLEGHLSRHDQLRRGRHLAFDVETVTVFPTPVETPDGLEGGHYCSVDEVADLVQTFEAIDEDIGRALQAALQRVTTIKPSKRRANVEIADSRGSVLKEIEREIANLDRWQKSAAIETPEGPQRIRGLAGSGKTIVLALKAAYLQVQHPDWRIVVCFQSRSLYQQLQDLITRFAFEHSNDQPDFERLMLLHAWGASDRDGVYARIARHLGTVPRDFSSAAKRYGRDEAFAGVCRELLADIEAEEVEPLFDAVLIDEAQDLPAEFFRLVYRLTSEPKRIVWAFDELQNLSEAEMPSTAEMFGTTQDGSPIVSLVERDGEARRDIVLPVCYRNSPWALATAHALGFGIYRADGLVQHFDRPALWTDIGYQVRSGRLELGREVSLRRSPDASPPYFKELLSVEDAVALKTFDTEADQDSWVADAITRNLDEDELEVDDILIVLPDAYTSKRRSVKIIRALADREVISHLAGVGSSVDEIFVHDSVAVAHIHRAKGNEAPMVYVLDAQYATRPGNAVARRNTLFTAITRSRAWVRVCAWGPGAEDLALEVSEVERADFELHFTIPSSDELENLRRVHWEEEDTRSPASFTLAQMVEAIETGEIDIEDLPPKVRTRLALLMASTEDDAPNS